MLDCPHAIPNKHDKQQLQDCLHNIDKMARSYITKIARIHPHVVQVTMYAPFALKNYQPGHFFRIQPYEQYAQQILDPISAFPCAVDNKQHTFSFYLLHDEAYIAERFWHVGDNMAVMGPTGVKTAMKPVLQHTLLVLDYSQIGPGGLLAQAIHAAGFAVTVVVFLQPGETLYGLTELEKPGVGECRTMADRKGCYIIWVSFRKGNE